MLHHFVTATETAYVVAYQRPAGDHVIVVECMTEAAAKKEANRLNAECQARAALAARVMPAAPRRAVRYFEDDVFA